MLQNTKKNMNRLDLKKVSIGSNFVDGPWGGGNNFAIQLRNYLIEKGIVVINHLNDKDIDLILITEPRRYTKISSFTHIEVLKYIKFVNSNTLVVNRINECDERKDTKNLNNFIINSSNVSDHTIFISNWLLNLFVNQGFEKKSYSVIRNGGDENIFYTHNKKINKKLSIVTHHWGDNENKGKVIYEKMDELLNNPEINANFEFTYIGNLPKNSYFENIKVIKPLFGESLSGELRNHDVYLTGSINEPAGMHHIEGALCGLPILFIESGGITEYCKDFGISYKIENLEEKIYEMKNGLDFYKKKLQEYPFTGQKMCMNYYSLFLELLENKERYYLQRRLPKIPMKQYRFLNKYFFI